MREEPKAQSLVPEVADELTSGFEKPDVDALVDKGKEALTEAAERIQKRAEKTKAGFKRAMNAREPFP